MVEFLLISVGIVALLLFVVNMRTLGTGTTERQVLDGNPHWEHGTVTAIEHDGEYLGHPTAVLQLEFGGRAHEAKGVLPRPFSDALTEGLQLEGHIEYDVLDTLRTPMWDASPAAVLRDCAAKLGVEPAIDLVAGFQRFVLLRGGRNVEALLPEDGWLTIVVEPRFNEETSVDLRADFDGSEGALMLTDRLGVSRDQADEHGDLLQRLSESTLHQIEQFTLSTDGWVCVDNEGVEFECALPFAHGDVVASLIDEAVSTVVAIDGDLAPADAERW